MSQNLFVTFVNKIKLLSVIGSFITRTNE